MAQKIKKEYSVEHSVKGLEKSLKLAKELEKLGAENSKIIKDIETELATLKADPSPDEETLKYYYDRVAEFNKQNAEEAEKNIVGVGKASKQAAEASRKRIEDYEEEIEEIEKIEAALDKAYSPQEDGSFEPSGDIGRSSLAYQDKVQPKLEKKMGKDAINPFSDKSMSNLQNYLEAMERFDKVLDGAKKSNQEFVKGIREKAKAGAAWSSLTDKEQEYLNELKKNNKEIKSSGTEIFKQLKKKSRIQKEEQKTLQKLYSAEKEILKVRKEKAEIKRTGGTEGEADFKKQVEDVENLTESEKKANEELLKIRADSIKGMENAKKTKREFNKEQQRSTKNTKQNTAATKSNTSSLGQATKQVFNYGIAFTALRRIYRETISTIKNLDSALTELSIVTSMNREESWELVGVMQDLAKETGFTTTEIAKLSTVYFRQGRTLREVIELTRVAAKAARVAGISATESADFLTSAVNAFRLSADEALAVSDRFAALAASSASSYQELATGLSKFAAQANVAGIGIDFAMGMLAKGVETTREAPETIGTAIKSVTARMRELSDLGKTFEDGMDINRVETALRQVGVALRDESGQFRNLEDVLTDVGMKWETLNKNQQASVAVALAGIRQQSRLISIMNDFDRTMELVDISTESAGATMAQHAAFMQGMEAATVGLQTAYQQLITTITDSEVIIGIIRGLGTVIESLAEAFERVGFVGQTAMVAILGLLSTLKLLQIATKHSVILTKIHTVLTKQNTLATKASALAQAFKNKAIDIGTKVQQEYNGVMAFSIKQTYLDIKAKIKQQYINLQTILSNKGLLASHLTLAKGNLALIATFKALTAALLISPYTWVAIAVGILIKGFIDLQNGTDSLAASFTSSFSGGLTSAINLVKVLFDALVAIFKPILQVAGAIASLGVIKTLFGPMLALTTALTVLPPILNLITTAINYIITAFRMVVNVLENFATRIPLIGKVVKGFEVIKEAIIGLSKATEELRKESEKALEVQSKSYEELAESIKKVREESAAENYELNRKNRSIAELIEERKELARLRDEGIFGEEELKREADLIAEIRNLDQGEFLRFDSAGNVDLNASFEALEEEQNSNIQNIRNNLRNTAESAVMLAQKDIDKFLKNEDGALDDVQNYLLNLVDEDLTKDQTRVLKEYYKELIESTGKADLESLAEKDFYLITRATSDFTEEIKNNEKGILGLREAYEKIEDNLLAKLGQEAADAFASANTSILALLDSVENLSDEELSSIEPILNITGRTNSDLNRLSGILEGTGIKLNHFLLEAGRIQKIFEEDGMDPDQAARRSIIEIASSMSDSVVAAQLYGEATSQSILDVAQSADLLSSKFSNLSDKQASFISGELKAEDLYNLIQDYSELFANPEFFEAFRSGGDLSRFLTDQLIEQYKEYEIQLNSVESQIADLAGATSEENLAELEGLKSTRNTIIAMMEYSGVLRNLTETQYDLNNATKAFNRINELGLETVEDRKRVLDALIANTGPALRLLNDEFQNIVETIEEKTGQSAENIFEIVDGVVVMKDGFNDLSDVMKTIVENNVNLLDENLQATFNYYGDLIDETIAYEEKLAEEKIKVYEDYFDSLDRLESRRETQMDRQSIIEQISRLQGATDEASRKRSLELQQELNKLNEKSEEEIIKEARKSLIDSVNEALKNTKDEFREVFNDWINSGEANAESLFLALKAKGLVDDNGWTNPTMVIENNTDTEETEDPEINTNLESNALTNPSVGHASGMLPVQMTEEQKNKIKARAEFNSWLKDNYRKPLIGPAVPPSEYEQKTKREQLLARYGIDSFRKGGMVDYNGLAMLHGSKTKPEAVLNPEQTEIFKKIPQMLESLQSGGAISIDNISISTESLNTNQDFASAGESLAKAFRDAVQRKGVTLNTKR